VIADPLLVMRYAYLMKRTTVMFPEDVDARLRREARRRGVPVAEVVREAVERHLPAPEPGLPLSFFGVGEGGPADASERVDEYVTRAVRRRRGG
jgi:Ribbon-helix-helix protein, copG family